MCAYQGSIVPFALSVIAFALPKITNVAVKQLFCVLLSQYPDLFCSNSGTGA
jgi:hypothetical protein